MSDKDIVQGGRDSIPVDSTMTFEEGPVVIQSCSTGNRGCYGVATFWNRGNQAASFTVWFRNGAAGRSNFVLNPGQTHGVQVQFGDTYSSIWGNGTVPDNAPRDWINVG